MSSNVILIPVLQLVAFFYFCKVRITQWRKKDFTDHGMPQASRSNPTIGGFSVRLNRESSFVGLLRDVHGVLWSGEVSSFPLSDSGFAKLDSDNRLVNSV